MAEFPRQFIIFIGMKPQNIFFFALQNEEPYPISLITTEKLKDY